MSGRVRLGLAAAAVAVAWVAEPVSGAHAHLDYPWHHLVGFDLGFGFAGCVVIVVVSKALGRAGIQRPDPEREP